MFVLSEYLTLHEIIYYNVVLAVTQRYPDECLSCVIRPASGIVFFQMHLISPDLTFKTNNFIDN